LGLAATTDPVSVFAATSSLILGLYFGLRKRSTGFTRYEYDLLQPPEIGFANFRRLWADAITADSAGTQCCISLASLLPILVSLSTGDFW